jgi:hypothetical protein
MLPSTYGKPSTADWQADFIVERLCVGLTAPDKEDKLDLRRAAGHAENQGRNGMLSQI